MVPAKKIKLTLLLSACLVALFGFMRDKPNDKKMRSSHYWINKTHNPSQFDLIIFGDSRAHQGISPATIVENANGLSAYNLGYSSAGMSNDMFDLIESRLDKSKAPTILLAVTPYGFTPNPLKNQQYREYAGMSYLQRKQSLLLDEKLQFFAPISPKDILRSSKDVEENNRTSYTDSGWTPVEVSKVDSTRALISYRNNFINNIASKKAIDNLLVRVKKWTAQGINVAGVRPFITNDMKALEDSLSGFSYPQFIASFEVAGGHWIEVHPSIDLRSYDGSHMDKQSAIRFSEKIGEKLFSNH